MTNDFTGSLKLKATNKSGFHRVKSGVRDNGTASTKILETVSTSSTEKFAKYMLYMQDTLTPASCAVVEFNVMCNSTNARALSVVSVMVSDTTDDFSRAFNANGEYQIVVLSSGVGTITTNPGEIITDAQVSSACTNAPNPTQPANSFLIKFNDCLLRDYAYTLYKMSIEA